MSEEIKKTRTARRGRPLPDVINTRQVSASAVRSRDAPTAAYAHELKVLHYGFTFC